MKKFGFTMIELLLYMGLFSVLIAILGSIFLDIMELQLTSRSYSEVVQNSNYIFSRLGYDAYRATAINSPSPAGISGSSMTLVIGSPPYYTYSLSGTNLILTTPTGSYTLNSNDVSVTNFTVTRLGLVGKPNVNVSITIESNIVPLGKSAETASYTQSFTLR
jgi:hypothetical protein